MVILAALVLVVAGARNHQPAEAAVLVAALAVSVLAGWWLLRGFRAHPLELSRARRLPRARSPGRGRRRNP